MTISTFATLICEQCGSRLNFPRQRVQFSSPIPESEPFSPARCGGCGTAVRPAGAVPIAPPPIGTVAPPPIGTVAVAGTHALVQLTGDLDIAVADRLRDALTTACESGHHVIVDMSQVRLIDSTALSALVRAHQHSKRDDRALCLVQPSRFVVTVLHTMRLLRIFPIFDSQSDAAAWLTTLGPSR